jgi:hypothetical protein
MTQTYESPANPARFNAYVGRKLDEIGIPRTLLDESPYSVWSVQEFDAAIQVMQRTGILEFMRGKFVDDKKRWQLAPYIQSVFAELARENQFLFEPEFDALFVRTPETAQVSQI